MAELTANEKRCEKRILDALKDEDCTFDRLVHLTKFTPQTVRRILEYMGLEMDFDGYYSYPKNYKPTGVLPPVKQQSSNETPTASSVEPISTNNKQQTIKEKPMQRTEKLQKTGLFTNINTALEEQIKRLTQPDLDPETMNLETMRTRGLTSISEQFIKQGQVVIEATKLDIEYGGNRVDTGLLTIGG